MLPWDGRGVVGRRTIRVDEDSEIVTLNGYSFDDSRKRNTQKVSTSRVEFCRKRFKTYTSCSQKKHL